MMACPFRLTRDFGDVNKLKLAKFVTIHFDKIGNYPFLVKLTTIHFGDLNIIGNNPFWQNWR